MSHVLITARSFGASSDSALELLQAAGCTVERIAAEELPKQIHRADAIIAGLEHYDAELLSRATNLRVISRYGVGIDAIDIGAARNSGVRVTITPGANTQSVAEMAIALMFSCARLIPLMDAAIRKTGGTRPQGTELQNKTACVVGTGRIGALVAEMLHGMGMKVTAFDIEPSLELLKLGIEYVDLETALETSDVVSLHLPLTAETRTLIDERRLAKMKENAILINTSRAGLIDEAALFDALTSNRLFGAGLDVSSIEEGRVSRLIETKRCVLTPHAGAATVESSERMSMMAARNVIEVLSNQPCQHEVLSDPLPNQNTERE